MNQYDTFEREIFSDLFRSQKPIEIFHFHKEYRLSPAQIHFFLARHSKDDLVEINENRIFLTTKGKKYVWKNRFEIFEENFVPTWRPKKDNKELLENKIELNTPHFKWLDKRLINLSKDEFKKSLAKKDGTGR